MHFVTFNSIYIILVEVFRSFSKVFIRITFYTDQKYDFRFFIYKIEDSRSFFPDTRNGALIYSSIYDVGE
jgi:hypothetical protein